VRAHRLTELATSSRWSEADLGGWELASGEEDLARMAQLDRERVYGCILGQGSCQWWRLRLELLQLAREENSVGATLEAVMREDGSIARRKVKVEGKVVAFYEASFRGVTRSWEVGRPQLILARLFFLILWGK
jgi:hypothetical protein